MHPGMELSEFAATILFGTTLAEKLTAPTGPWRDERRAKPIVVPTAPGRPAELAFPARARRVQHAPTPTAARLVDPRERGLALLAFANHELLALELMALALLRFPEAPSGFRLGLARAMGDEQRHLAAYLTRAHGFGVEAHDAPLSRFFWDCLAATPSPLAFVCGMSMTLEQANLDFAGHFQQEFTKAGDLETAAILAEVYRDEIRHVQHGVHWFDTWRDREQSAFAAYEKALVAPLTPARGRGIGFDRTARLAAGLDDTFIAEMAAFRASKGRNPRLFWFNADCELELGGEQPSQAARKLAADLAPSVAFLASEEDVVWVPRRPSRGHLDRLASLGFAIPRFVETAAELTQESFSELHPWGGSPTVMRTAASLTAHERAAGRAMGPFASKAWAVELAAKLDPDQCESQLATSPSEAELAIARLAEGGAPLVLKAPWGTAGGGMRLVAAAALSEEDRAWLRAKLASQGSIIVEKWRQRIADLSVQIDTSRSQDPLIASTRFLVDARGRYRGHYLQKSFEDLPTNVLRQLYGDEGFLAKLRETARSVAAHLTAAGYRGPAGIDAFLYEDEAGVPQVRPLVEVNVRYTMGRVALALARHVHHSRRSLWLHVPLGKARRAGWKTLAEMAGELEARYPMVREKNLLHSGVCATCDPSSAQVVLPLLFVGEACQAAEAFL